MANPAWYQGLQPAKGMTPDRPRVGYYPARAYSTGGLGIGTPMVINSTGAVGPLAVSTAASQLPIIGVLAEFHKSGVAAGKMLAIWDDPEQIFEVRCNATAITGQTAVGTNVRIVSNTTNAAFNVSGACNTTTGFSKARVRNPITTISTCKVLGLSRAVGQEAASGGYNNVLVKFNAGVHFYSRITGV